MALVEVHIPVNQPDTRPAILTVVPAQEESIAQPPVIPDVFRSENPIENAERYFSLSYRNAPMSPTLRAAHLALEIKRRNVDIAQVTAGLSSDDKRVASLVNDFNNIDINSNGLPETHAKFREVNSPYSYRPVRELKQPHTSESVKNMIDGDFSLAGRLSNLDEGRLKEIASWYPRLFSGSVNHEYELRRDAYVMVAEATGDRSLGNKSNEKSNVIFMADRMQTSS